MIGMYEILRDNLVRLRKNRGLTQVELAEILKYSDKSVSKWETGETLPSIETLVHLSDFYGVAVDDLLRKPVDVNKEVAVEKIKIINKKIVIALAISAVWLLAVAIFVGLIITDPSKANVAWICFVWALPVTFVICIAISIAWGRRHIEWWTSFFNWTMITAIYLSITIIGHKPNYWLLFLIGVPIQIIIILLKIIKDGTIEKYVSKRQEEEKTE